MTLYFATDNQHRMPMPPEIKGNARFDLWLQVAQWYSDHYGDKCKGWWVDGLIEFVKDYPINMHKALRHLRGSALTDNLSRHSKRADASVRPVVSRGAAINGWRLMRVEVISRT